MITVRQLALNLLELDPEAIVVMSSDAEGNYHSPYRGVWPGYYRAETRWNGEVFDESDVVGHDNDDNDVSYSKLDGDIKCVVLNPMN